MLKCLLSGYSLGIYVPALDIELDGVAAVTDGMAAVSDGMTGAVKCCSPRDLAAI